MALVALPLDISSNSFLTVLEADSYFDERVGSVVWTDAAEEDKERALIQASRELSDLFDWKGYRREIDQRLAFPRYSLCTRDDYYVDDDKVPREIKESTCELAVVLLSGSIAADSPLDEGLNKIKVGDIELNFSKDERTDEGVNDYRGFTEKMLMKFSHWINDREIGCLEVQRV